MLRLPQPANQSKTLEQARQDLDLVVDAFKRSPTYNSALAVQKAQKDFEAIIAANRQQLTVIDGRTDKRTEQETTTAALKRIILEIENSSEKYDRTLLYVHRLAKQALIEAGCV
jgi:hypothetical protein